MARRRGRVDRADADSRVAAFALSQSGTGVRGYHPRKIFGILYAIWCILRQSGGSYLQAVRPVATLADRSGEVGRGLGCMEKTCS